MHLTKTKELFTELNVAPSSQIKGCSKDEVKKLEEKFNVTLPEAYKEFLLWMGKAAGDFMKGSDFFYERLFDLRESAEALLEDDNSNFTLPKNAFVFWVHQGYQFAFFNCESDNLAIFYYMEGEGAKKIYDTFEDFLIEEIRNHASV